MDSLNVRSKHTERHEQCSCKLISGRLLGLPRVAVNVVWAAIARVTQQTVAGLMGKSEALPTEASAV